MTSARGNLSKKERKYETKSNKMICTSNEHWRVCIGYRQTSSRQEKGARPNATIFQICPKLCPLRLSTAAASASGAPIVDHDVRRELYLM